MARANNPKPAPQAGGQSVVKAYNITTLDGNRAEINMYGEVVDAHPVDWWTGQPVEGNFIALNEFLADLDELKSKAGITIHLNSVGGSAHAGLAIRNRLREMADVTVIVDSLAASAGSMILQGASKGKRYVREASQVMVHGVSGLLIGYYNISDLQDVIKQFESTEKAYRMAYMESGGQSEKQIAKDVAATTWLVGQEAVDAGYADAVLPFDSDAGDDVQQLASAAVPTLNGVPQFWRMSMPAAMAMAAERNKVPPTAAPEVEHKNKIEQEAHEAMEIKNMDELRNAYPDLAAQIENAAKAEGVKHERERIKGIEAIENAIADKDLVNEAKFGTSPMTAEQLAFKAMQAQASLGVNMLAKMDEDAKKSGAAAVEATPNGGDEQPTKAEKEAEVVNMIVGAHAKNQEG